MTEKCDPRLNVANVVVVVVVVAAAAYDDKPGDAGTTR